MTCDRSSPAYRKSNPLQCARRIDVAESQHTANPSLRFACDVLLRWLALYCATHVATRLRTDPTLPVPLRLSRFDLFDETHVSRSLLKGARAPSATIDEAPDSSSKPNRLQCERRIHTLPGRRSSAKMFLIEALETRSAVGYYPYLCGWGIYWNSSSSKVAYSIAPGILMRYKRLKSQAPSNPTL